MTPYEIMEYVIEHEEKNLIMFGDECERQNRVDTLKFAYNCMKFVTHIQNHLNEMGRPTEKVICKICGKTVAEIANENDK